MSLATTDDTTFPKMSTAGYVQEGKYQKRHRAAFGLLICVALTLFLLVVASVSVFGWYLITNRDQDVFVHLFGERVDSGDGRYSEDSGDLDYPSSGTDKSRPGYDEYDADIYVNVTHSMNLSDTPIQTTTTATTSTTTATTTTTFKPITTKELTTPTPPSQIVTTTTTSAVINTELTEVMQRLWDMTSHRQFLINKDYMLSFQGRTNFSDTEDKAPRRLFARMKSDIRGSQINKHFVRLLKSYTSRWNQENGADVESSHEVAKFLQYASSAEAFVELERFLNDKDLLGTTSFPELIESAWFHTFTTSSHSTNGFQRVFVGGELAGDEMTGDGVGEGRDGGSFVGLNNWIQFYLLEKEKTVNYQGYIRKHELGLVEVRYTLSNSDSPHTATLFVGTPPDFEMAMYTLCLVVRSGQSCQFTLEDHDVNVIVHTQAGSPGQHVLDAHPVL